MFKNKKLLTILILLICIIPSIVGAATLEMTGTYVSIRTGPGTNYSSLGQTIKEGEEYTLKTTNLTKTEKGCDSGYWYNIDYKGQSAYICSSYAVVKNDKPLVITDEARTQCETELKNAGFPVAYWTKLCELKIAHPTWVFESVYTGYDFAAAVAGEQCKGSISKSSRADYQDGTCNKSYDSGYTGASQIATAYYMNPLNFLDEKHVFMFETAYVNEAVKPHYSALATKTSNSTLVKNIPELPTYISNASVASNVSATFLAARIKQELGSGILGAGKDYAGQLQSALSGNYTDRFGYYYSKELGWSKDSTGRQSVNNYYNFYNIGASDGTGITQKALAYAFKQGWGGPGLSMSDARQKAVTGGADWIYRNYINAGQQTMYFNKFNVNPNTATGKFQHQYMTNIDAASSEGNILYTAYKNSNLLELPFKFLIPVYDNLNADIQNSPGGATGDTSNENTGLSPTTMVVSSGYTLDGSTITDIKSSTAISDFTGKISSQGGEVQVYSNNALVSEGNIGTGMTIRVKSSAGENTFNVIIKGDTSGDGVINVLDLLQVKKYLLGQKDLSGGYKTAADTSGDGTVNVLDLLQIKKYLLGQKEL